MSLTVTGAQNAEQNQLYNITRAANPTTVPNYNATQNGGPLENAVVNGAKATYNFLSEHADPVKSAVEAARAFYYYSKENNPADLYEGLEGLAELGFAIFLH